MNKLEKFISLLAGKFDNKEQHEAIKTQNPDYPFAMHVNTVCNEKIRNLPNDFKGIFLLEESYYFTKGMKNTSPHLFLFTEENSNVKLVSYKIPEGYDKKTFFIGADYAGQKFRG